VKLAKVIVQRGKILTGMGIAYEKAHHLFPEEILYLMERSQVVVKDAPSRQQLYAIVGLSAYLVYSYYKNQSYIVRRNEPFSLPTRQPGCGTFHVFLPNAKFSKRNPGTPKLSVMVAK